MKSLFSTNNNEAPPPDLNPICHWYKTEINKNNPCGMSKVHQWFNNPRGKGWPKFNPSFDDGMFQLLKNACRP